MESTWNIYLETVLIRLFSNDFLELEARGLNSKGLKSQLAARLQEAVTEEEQNGDQNKEMPSEGNENVDNPTNKGNF